jgi:hypothetical protein
MDEKQSRRPISKGKCNFCGQLIAKSGINRHLQACKQRKAILAQSPIGGRQTRILHLAVEGRYAIDYWMHIETPATFTLLQLDRFLRDIWLECCGHLSRFTIGEQQYDYYLDEEDVYDDNAFGTRMINQFKQIMGVDPPEDMIKHWLRPAPKHMKDAVLGDILKPGMQFYHEYDFGTTTDLALKVQAEREAQASKKFGLQILARNNPPDIRCAGCHKEAATVLCLECMWDGTGAFCKECASKHLRSHDMFLPVVNSPRVGMCGYTGDAPDDWGDW